MKLHHLKFISITSITSILSITLYWYLLTLSALTWGQNIGKIPTQKIPTQDDIIKNGVIRYFKRLPVEGWERLFHLSGLGSYNLMLHHHQTNPLASPFRIFNSTSNRRTPSIEWSLSMKNNDYEYEDILIKNYGLCAGLTMTTRKLQLLAHFDPNNLEKQKIPAESNREAWFQFMKKKIDDMMTFNRMSIIPNFANIHEFTAHPFLEHYFKEHIIRQWELVNINFLQGLFQGFGGTLRTMNKETTFNNLESLKVQLSLGINPIIFMAAPSQRLLSKSQWVHVVQVVKIIRHPDAYYAIEIWDPNLDDPRLSKVLKIYDTGEIYFGNKELAGIYPLKWDTFEIADMVEKNLDFCAARPGFCITKPKAVDPIRLPPGSSSPTGNGNNSPNGFQNQRIPR